MRDRDTKPENISLSDLVKLTTCREHGDPTSYGCLGCDAAIAHVRQALVTDAVRAVKLRRHFQDVVLRYAAHDLAHSIAPAEISRALRRSRALIRIAEAA